MTASLFDPEPEPDMRRDAVLSDCQRYRYLLTREWQPNGKIATFVMLNPSTADANIDDPTIRRCIGFAEYLGCSGLAVVNLYAWRATKPAALWTTDDPIGPDNDAHIIAAADTAYRTGAPLIGAWGANAQPDRIAAVLDLPGMDRITALAVTKDGQPRHPLYLRADLMPQPWRAA